MGDGQVESGASGRGKDTQRKMLTPTVRVRAQLEAGLSDLGQYDLGTKVQ